DPRSLAITPWYFLAVLERSSRRVLRVWWNGATEVLSSDDVGSGTLFQDPRAIVFAQGRLLVADASTTTGLFAILSVNVQTRERSLVSSSAIGTGIALSANVSGACLGPDGNLLVTDATAAVGYGLGAVVQVDVTTAERALVSGHGRGTGPLLGDNFFVYGPRFIALGPPPPPPPSAAGSWRGYE
ncbi:MAG: hypothetical protein NTW86_30815, partial [Candidatus Sumerlaeota bacterium]|nr:hypothetical protein [Candidatus Sumerlaeota bacterium]